MAVNLFDLAKATLTPDLMQQVSALIGESPTNTQKAVDSAIPSVLAGLLNFASSSGDGPERLISLLTQGNYANVLSNLSNLLSGGNASQDFLKTGRDLLDIIFGGKLNPLTDLVANNSGIKSTSASSLLSLVAPLLLGLLGRETVSQGLNPSNLISLLLSQKDLIAKVAPAGLAGVLGLANLGNLGAGLSDVATTVATGPTGVTTTRAAETVREGSFIGKWLIPLLLAGLLVPWILFSRGCGEGPTPAANVGDAEANKKLSQDRADSVKAMMTEGGIDAARLSTMGYGQEKPTASNDTEEGRAQNRRLELVVTKK